MANETVVGSYDNNDKLVDFAKNVDVLTYEFENIETKALEELEKIVEIRPSIKALKICQDRYTEKSYLNALDIKTTQFYKIDEVQAIEELLIKVNKPILIKTRKLGYDGKGQVLVKTQNDIKENFEIVKRCVQRDGSSLEFASDHLKDDETIVTLALA